MKTIAKPTGYGACPTHFWATCRRASEGGTNSYKEAGYQLVMHIGALAPYDIEEDDWEKHLQELSDLIWGPPEEDMTPICSDDTAVLAWFDRWVPRCMALIPQRRRGTFLEGVYRHVLVEGRAVGE